MSRTSISNIVFSAHPLCPLLQTEAYRALPQNETAAFGFLTAHIYIHRPAQKRRKKNAKQKPRFVNAVRFTHV